jgi:hypothetical protein
MNDLTFSILTITDWAQFEGKTFHLILIWNNWRLGKHARKNC